jgi:molybdopterin/thiamine biosynthesis adenylyltransferase
MVDTTQIMIEEERYKRQTLIWGNDGQKRLQNARVSVVGMDKQGLYAALCLTALGVGNISLIDGESVGKNENFLGVGLQAGKPRAKAYGDIMQLINPQINIEAYQTNLESRLDIGILTKSDVVLETTNNPRLKSSVLDYSWRNGIPVLSTSSKRGYTKTMFCNPATKNPAYLMPMFEGHEQDGLMALVKCGVLAEEVRKFIFKETEQYLSVPVRYSVLGKRFGHTTQEVPEMDREAFSKINAAFLGGGALGCWAALAAEELGFQRLDVFDYDVFESHNINRQILGFDGIGKPKAPHIADKIKVMTNGRTKSEGFNVKILPGFKTERKYDVVYDFVDNAYTRALNTAFAIANDIPMISAGALPFSARSITQVADKTQCLNCIYDIYADGRREEMIRRASCAANPNPSVVMSNACGAAMSMIDTLYVVEPEKFGEPFNGELTYRSTNPQRFGTNRLNNPCNCYTTKPMPNLEISDKDVKKFVAEHPEALKQVN